MFDKAILDGHKVVPVDDVFVWGKWLQGSGELRIVEQTTLKNKLWVSTVFLGINHNWKKGKFWLT